MKKITPIIIFLLLATTSVAFTEQPIITDEQIRKQIHEYVEDKYKHEKGKRSKDDIRKDFIEGTAIRVLNESASRGFTEKNFAFCKTFADLSIKRINRKKAKLDVMPMVRENIGQSYFILADCYIAEVLEKLFSAKSSSPAKIFQQERANIEKAIEYYTKASDMISDSMLKAVIYFNIGSMYLNLSDREKGIQFLTKAFNLDDKVFSLVKSEREKGNMVLVIYHTDKMITVKK